MNQEEETHCNLCSKLTQPFTSLMQYSLYAKHSQNVYSTREIDDILEQNLSVNFVRFQDYCFFDNDEELLKREYGEHEFDNKIRMLSEYYKFHRDIPVWNNKHIEGIMGKYYSRIKDVDYKKIKKVLKEEEGVSLTTQKSCSSFEGSEYTKKSKYSTMLHDLEKSNESIKLMDICKKMDDALKKVESENDFKGEFFGCGKKFEDYLHQQKKRKQSNVGNNDENRKSKGFEKPKLNEKKSKKVHDIIGLRQIIFASNHSIKEKKYETLKNTISNSKTTANDTISREEITKREKSRSNQLPTGVELLSSRNYESKYIVNELVHSKLKHLNEFNFTSIIKKDKPKKIKDIYGPVEKKLKNKNSKELNKKISSKLKERSKSQQVIPTFKSLNKNPSKKMLNPSLNPLRKTSCKSLTKSSKFATIEIDHFQGQQKGSLSYRQNEKNISRSNSTGKISSWKSKQYETENIEDKKGNNKRTIDEILETKLMGMKKKPILI